VGTKVWSTKGKFDPSSQVHTRARLYFPTYVADMKECDAPELNSTTTEVSLMRNIPMTTSRASCASSMAT
jgi:hypothetical protein